MSRPKYNESLAYNDMYSQAIKKIMNDNNLREAYFVHRDRVVMLEVLQYNFFDYYENWSYVDSDYVLIYFSNTELYKNHFIGSSVLFSNRNVYFNPLSFTSRSIITSQNGALMRTIDNEYFNVFAAGNKVVSWIQSDQEPVLQSNSISFTSFSIIGQSIPFKKRSNGELLISTSLLKIFTEDSSFNLITFFLLEAKNISIIIKDKLVNMIIKFDAPENTQFFQVKLPYFVNEFSIEFSKMVNIDNIFFGSTPLCGNRALYFQRNENYINPLLHILPEFINYNFANKVHEYNFNMNSLANYFSIIYISNSFYQNLTNIDYKFNQNPLEIENDNFGSGFIFNDNNTIITAEVSNEDYNSNLGMYILPIDSSCLTYYCESKVNNNYFLGRISGNLIGTEQCNESYFQLLDYNLFPTSVLDNNSDNINIRDINKRFFPYDMNPLNYVIKYFDNDFDYLKYFSFSIIPNIIIKLGTISPFTSKRNFNISLFDRLDKFNYFCLYCINTGFRYNSTFFYSNDLCAYQSRGIRIPSLVVNESFINPVWQPLKKNINSFTIESSSSLNSNVILYLFIK